MAATPFDFLASRANHGDGGYFVESAALIGSECYFQRGNNQLIHAQGAKQRMTADTPHKILFAGDDSGLWSAQQFVPAESDQGHSGFDTLPDGGFVNSVRRQINQAAGTQILDQRQA